MIVVGLTGSIAMGKTETARILTELGIPVFDSDAEVHALYGPGGAAVTLLRDLIPTAIRNGGIDRQALSAELAKFPQRLDQIEAIVHPLVRKRQETFLTDCLARGTDIAVLDIPLLFETNQQNRFDHVIVVSAPPHVQHRRALLRPGMTPEKLNFILARQIPDSQKRQMADFIVDTSTGFDDARRQIEAIIAKIREKAKETQS